MKPSYYSTHVVFDQVSEMVPLLKLSPPSLELATYLRYEETIVRFDLLRSKIGDTAYFDIGMMMMDAIRHKIQVILILLDEQERMVIENEVNPQLDSVLLIITRYRMMLQAQEQKYNEFFNTLCNSGK